MVIASTKENAGVADMVENSLTIFVEAVELSSDLEIIGTSFSSEPRNGKNEEVFIIRDYTRDEGIEGAYIEVSIDEIAQKVTDADRAQEIIRVIQNDRASIVLNGITRIVGYYSRVNNWNKSKVGELRDRAAGRYGLTQEKPLFQTNRLDAIDAL